MPPESDGRLKTIETELSLLKNQVQQTLLDIREHVLEFTNPFTAEARLVRAWQERTAQAAQTNLAGPEGLNLDQLAEEPPAAAATPPPPPPEPAQQAVEDFGPPPLEAGPVSAAPQTPTPVYEPELDYEPEAAYGSETAYEPEYAPEGYEPQPEPERYEPQPEPERYEPQPEPERYGPQPEPERYEPQSEPERYGPQPEPEQPEPERYEPQPEPGTASAGRAETASAEPTREQHEPTPTPADAAPVEPQMPEPSSQKLDLITLTSLVRWVDQNTRRIGKDRVEVILDIYEMSGRISEETKDLVKRLCALNRDEDDGEVPVREVVGAMLSIDSVLDEKASQSQRLLGMLFDDAFEPLPHAGNGVR